MVSFKKPWFYMAMIAILLIFSALFNYLRYDMDPEEVVRKLSGIRIAVGLYKQNKHKLPENSSDLIRSGYLQAIPELKLKRHTVQTNILNAQDLSIKDTGGWAYVNNPKDPAYGSVFIDCSHADYRGRYWSWF